METSSATDAVHADPIFEMINHHKQANAAYREVCHENGTDDPDPEKEQEFVDREEAARDALASTVPSTLQGLLEVLKYVEATKERGDITFGDESLLNLLISAQDCVADHLAAS